MRGGLVLVLNLCLLKFTVCEEQDIAPVTYAVEGKEVSLPCAIPSAATLLKWVFHKNGTNFDKDAAQVFPGSISNVFPPFNSPSDRSSLVGGSFIIHRIRESEEGWYWCEISQVNVPTAKSRKYPVHVYVTPQNPKLASLANNTLTEYKETPVARCTSQAGKPGATLRWMNGSVPLPGPGMVVKENAFNTAERQLTDVDLDLTLESPTRYDHNRTFQCIVEHPSYDEPKVLNYTVLVQYHPINIRVWANLTSLYVFCEAESYPKSTYHWTMPGSLTGFTGPSLYVPDLYSLPGGGRFECTATNGISPNATIRVLVDNLRYPNGVPGLAGLAWWIWGVIGGAVLAIIVIIIIVVCRKCKNKDKGETVVKYKKPIVKTVDREQTRQHPTTLPLNNEYRVPDGREDSFDSRTPSPVNEHKQALIDGVFDQNRDTVALVPSNDWRRSQERLFDDDRRNTGVHASREQLDMVASHISTLNHSWDQLSKSRQALNEAQDELQHINSNLSKSREQLYHSREALNRENDHNYPYIDDDTRGQGYGHQEEHDGRRQPPPAYDYNDSYRRHGDQGYGNYNDGPQYDQRYDDRRGYDDYDRRDDYHGYGQDYQYDGYGDDRRGYDQYDERRDNPSQRII